MTDLLASQPSTTADPGPSKSGPVVPTNGVLSPLSMRAIGIAGGFLGRLQRDNGGTSIPGGHAHLLEERAWDNLRHAADRQVGGDYHGPVFEDGEVFKWLEAAAWENGRRPDEQLNGWLERYADLAARAQAEDGYLSTFNQVAGVRGRYEWISYDHEIFNMATMIQAAVADFRSSGRTALLDVAIRAADHLDRIFGWGKREELCGHPLVEMALVELYRVTGERRYLDLARYFVDKRGHRTIVDPTWQNWDSVYFSDRIPVREAVAPEGHAVRAVYLAAGATDVAVETNDDELLAAVRQQWDAMVETKMYLNGSLGSRWEGEAFGDPYELPNDRGYGETCAAIASMQWSWRLLLATGEPRYADLIERQFYNAVLSGVSLDGDRYFYVNALQVRAGALPSDDRMPASGRREWFGCSCCPTNLMRTIATVHEYLATTSDRGVQLHQFAAAEIAAGERRLAVRTDFPWSGDVEIEVLATDDEPWELAIRVPEWADGTSLEIDGSVSAPPAGDYARIHRTWSAGDVVRTRMPFEPRFVEPHQRNDAARGSVAVRRGPLFYALEQVDQPAGVEVDDVELLSREVVVQRRDDLLGGVDTILLEGRTAPEGEPTTLVAVPYFMWANRVVGPMRVWIPLAKDADR